MKNVLICTDRDGTLIHDKKYNLGHQKNWQELVKILPTVIQGIELLNKLPNSKIYITTNQPGVAVKQFPLLTQDKAEQVCKFTMLKLKEKGAKIQGCEVCGHASRAYQKKRKEFKFEEKYICDCKCIKPKPGMIFTALKKSKFDPKTTSIYMIGDRATDIQAAHNVKGIGIYIPYKDTPDQTSAFKKIKFKFHKAKNFLQAAKLIIKLEKNKK
jgi:histidinol-phosphate phosphatase family protein